MKRLIAAVAGAALLAGGLAFGAPPATAASTVWNFPDGSIAVSDKFSGAPGEVRVSGLTITDGAVTGGVVILSGRQTFCSTRAFSGNSAIFSDLGAFGCTGSVEFQVSPSGQLSLSTQGLGGASFFVDGSFSSSIVGTQPAPIVVPLQDCLAAADLSAGEIDFTWKDHPDATDYTLSVNGLPGADLQLTPGSMAAVPFSLLAPGTAYGATITAKNSRGDVVATCTTNDVLVPWPVPGMPSIVGSPIGVVGGQVTVNYTVADPATVQGIEFRLDGGPWQRPGGTAPNGGVGGAFTVSGLSDGNHDLVLRSVGFDPMPLTTEGPSTRFEIPSAPRKPSSSPRPSQSASAPAIGSTPSKPVAAPPAAPVSQVSGTSNGAGTGTNGALAAATGDAGIDAPCLAQDGTLYPNQYSTVGSQLTMAPNTVASARRRRSPWSRAPFPQACS